MTEEECNVVVEHSWENDTCTRCGTFRIKTKGLIIDQYHYSVNGFVFGTSPPDCLIEFKEASDAQWERIKKYGIE